MTIKISKNNTEELSSTILTCIEMLSRVLDSTISETETSWYNLTTGMVTCSNDLLECNSEVIPCL